MTHFTAAPFEIEVRIHGEKKNLIVTTEETTDGAPYYNCLDKGEGENLAEVRKESDGRWVGLWGDLDEKSVQAIGEAIDAKPL